MSWWADSKHGKPLSAEGDVAVFLGVSVAMASSVSNRLDQCRYTICSGVHPVFEKQACGRGRLQDKLLVLI